MKFGRNIYIFSNVIFKLTFEWCHSRYIQIGTFDQEIGMVYQYIGLQKV
jgi:hypothetical protein